MDSAPSPSLSPSPPLSLNLASDPDTGCSDPLPLSGAAEDVALLSSEFLSREEVRRRRSRWAKQLARYYRDQYWALVEEVRVKIRDYYRSFGISPRVVDATGTTAVAEGSGENDGGATNKVFCGFSGCKSTAMSLTRYCYLHILCDSKQTLYKPCTFATCSGHPCGKPVLRTAVPSFCTFHIHKAKKHVSEAVNQAALRFCSSGNCAPNFQVIVTEYIHQIQINRRRALNASSTNNIVKLENAG